uniref:Reverse transcriptase domain-containing protein n=1 Tax=Sparus aurata TaxID=8175 RepID=A0A671UET3_SPAAU
GSSDWLCATVFVDLSAAYDTVNHRLLLKKILENTNDLAFTDLIRALLKDRRFYVVLYNKQSRWQRQRNGLPQGSVLAPLLYTIYTNDQPMDQNTERFIYAEDLCVTSQESTFEAVEANRTSALDELHFYYERNHLHTNPAKTKACSVLLLIDNKYDYENGPVCGNQHKKWVLYSFYCKVPLGAVLMDLSFHSIWSLL